MSLHPQVKALIDQIKQTNAGDTYPVTIQQQRDEYVAEVLSTFKEKSVDSVRKVLDQQISGPHGEIPIRIYIPRPSEKLPILVYFHGGGWIVGSIESHDHICRAIANSAQVIVVSVDYRLAPENPFPIGLEDCYTATKWVAQHATTFQGDPSRIAVAGDSSGGNLAAAVALMTRDQNGPELLYQVLIYPITDYHTPGTPSYEEFSTGYLLSRKDMEQYWNYYLSSPEQAKNSYASPLQATDFRGLPPALVITAEYDPLRDEAEAYAMRLQEAGISVKLKRYQGMIHGFLRNMHFLDDGKNAVEYIGHTLRHVFAGKK